MEERCILAIYLRRYHWNLRGDIGHFGENE